MIRLLALAALSISISLPAFGAAVLSKPATKTKTTTATTTKATRTTSSANSGKSTVSTANVTRSARVYKIVPMLGLASFTMNNYKIQGADIRSDEGLAIGVMGDYDLKGTQFALQGGLSFYQLGARIKGQNNIPVSGNAKLDYLAVTTAGKIYSPNRYFYGKAGIVTLLNTRSDYELKSPGRTEKGKLDHVRDMDFLLQAGGGALFPIQPGISMGVELTFNRGLLDVSTHGNGVVYNEGFMFSGVMSL